MPVARSYECPVCGGLVREAARVCSYCHTPIATVRCGRCFTMNVPEAQHCMSCGAELGLEPLPLAPDLKASCPRCEHRYLDAFLGPDGEILDCGSCGGQFVSLDILQVMLRRYENASLELSDRYRAGNPITDPLKYLRCPSCGDLMLRKNFGNVSGVVVDICAKHGTWFDVGELARVLAFVSDGGLDRSAAFSQREQNWSRSGGVEAAAGSGWPALQGADRTPSPDWAEMREAALAFVRWVRAQLK